MKAKKIHIATNSRKYRVLRASALDYYVWVEFLDDPGKEYLVMHYQSQ